MTHLTEPSSEAQTGGPPTADDNGGNNPAFAATIPFLARWLHAIASDGSLPSEALAVASVMARSAGIGGVAFTNWQRINVALGRNRRDLAVLAIMSELDLAGYLSRAADDRFVYGWSLLIPGGEL